jgi:hypothetical protein
MGLGGAIRARVFVAALCALAALAAATMPTRALAAEGITVELNKLEPRDGACRVYMVFVNATGATLASYKPDLVFFDTDGVIAHRIVVEGGPLPAGKTKVKLFDVDGLACSAIGRLLLNDIAACDGGTAAPNECLDLTSATSRVDTDFIK